MTPDAWSHGSHCALVMVTWFTLSTVTSDPPGCGDCDNCDNVKLGKSGFLIKGVGWVRGKWESGREDLHKIF